MPTKKNKLNNLLKGLQDFDDSVSGTFDLVDKEMESVKAKLKDTISAKTVEQVNEKFKDIPKQLARVFEPLISTFEGLKKKLAEQDEALRTALQSKLEKYNQLAVRTDSANQARFSEVAADITVINEQLKILEARKVEIPDFGSQIKVVQDKFSNILETMQENLVKGFEETDKTEELEKIDTQVKDLEKSIKQVRILALQPRGGGNANRNITVNANSVLGKYTDFNIQNSSTVGWTTRINEDLKRVDFFASTLTGGGSGTPGGADKQVQYNNATAFGGDPALLWSGSVLTVGQPGSVRGAIDLAGATAQTIRVQTPSTAGAWTLTLPANDGGAGQYLLTDGNGITQWASVTGGGGITRSVSVISVSSTLAAAASTDYMIFTNVGIQVTLPTAISNINLYTVKNMAASSVQVAAAAGQDIDGSATVLMPTQYEALNFISNGSVFGVT